MRQQQAGKSAKLSGEGTRRIILRGIGAGIFAVLGLAVLVQSHAALAQGFGWPWESEEPRRARPVPSEPVWREPETRQRAWNPDAPRSSGRSSICLRLEQRLVQESQGGNAARDKLPELNRELRHARGELRKLERALEGSDCYEWFLFSKQLRNSRSCRRKANQVDRSKRYVAELEAKRQDIESSSGQSYQDEIIRELARNNCGASYQQEARRRDRGPFSGLWQDEDSSGGGYGNNNGFRALPFATYRTVCVRLWRRLLLPDQLFDAAQPF